MADASSPEISIDRFGNAIAVWQQSDGSRFNIWSSRYLAGVGWGAATLIENNDAGYAGPPHIAADASGNALAVWHQSDGIRLNIWAARYDVSSGWGTPELIETTDPGARSPRVAMSANGDALVVWEQWDGMSAFNIVANRYTAGVGWGAPSVINTEVGDALNARLATGANGTTIVVWEQFAGVQPSIWARQHHPTSGWGDPRYTPTADIGFGLLPQVAVDANGNAIVVWQESDGMRYNIWAGRYTDAAGWGDVQLIESDNAGDAVSPKVAMGGDGRAIAVWEQFDGVRSNVWGSRSDPVSGWDPAGLLEDDNVGGATRPEIAVDSYGTGFAVWQQFDGTNARVRRSQYSPLSGWEAPSFVQPAGTNGDSQRVVVNGNGDAAIVWNEYGVRYSVWGSVLER